MKTTDQIKVVGATPYNGTYNERVDRLTLENSGLNWRVEEHPLYRECDSFNGGKYSRRIDGVKALVRSDNNADIAVMNKTYRIIQNQQIWDAMHESLAGVDFDIVGAGYIDGGAKMFIQAEVGDENFTVNGEQFRNYVTAWSSHDGTSSFELADTSERIVCRNTLSASHRVKGKAFCQRVRHTKNADVRFDDMMQNLEQIFDHRRKMFEDLNRIANLGITKTQAEQFATGFLSPTDKVSTQVRNKVNKIVNYFETGVGNRGETVYDLLNGFTEFYTHGDYSVTADGAKEAKRYVSSELGNGARVKGRVIDALTDNNTIVETIRRGEHLMKLDTAV